MEMIWISPTEYVTGDSSLQISYPSVSHPNTIVTSQTTGDLKWISMSLRLPPNVSIEEVIICYQVSNPLSFISQVRLAEMDTPDQAMVIHDDGTDLKSTSPVCYSSNVGGKVPTPGTAVTLALRLNFQIIKDNPKKPVKIMLGAVGVKVQPMGELCVNVRDFGAKGDGTDATQEIQAAIDFVASAQGGTVCVPPGLYRISQAIDLKDNVHLEGSGHHVTTLKLKDHLSLTAQQYLAGKGSLIRILGKQGVTVSGLRIDGNKEHNEWLGCQPGFQCQNRQQGIIIESDPAFHHAPPPQAFSKHCVIEDCRIENCVTDGIHVGHAHYITIRNCASHNNGIVLPAPTSNYLQCPECPDSWQNVLDYKCNFVPFEPWGIILAGHTEHCVIENCSAFGNPHGGIECWSQTSRYHQIRHCRADSIYVNPGVSGGPSPSVHHSIVGCFVDNRRILFYRKDGGDVCIGFYTASDVTIRDCYCITAYVAGISGGGEPADSNKGIVIANNRVERGDPIEPQTLPGGCPHAPPYAGINVAHLSDAIISNNTLTGEFTSPSGGAAIRIEKSRRVTVTGNSTRGLENYTGEPVANPTRGILLFGGCEEVSVTANTVSGFRRGLDEGASHDNAVIGNILRNNQQPVVAGTNSVYTANVT